jgi:hypothetical protein
MTYTKVIPARRRMATTTSSSMLVETMIAKNSQEMLAEKIGITRARASVFLSKFKKWPY